MQGLFKTVVMFYRGLPGCTHFESGWVGGPVYSPPTSVKSTSRSAFSSTANRLASESLSLKLSSDPSCSRRKAVDRADPPINKIAALSRGIAQAQFYSFIQIIS